MERSLVDRLRDNGYLTAADGDRVDRALPDHATAAECVIRLGILEETALRRAIGRITSAPAIDLVGKTVEPAVLALVGASLARKHRCLPLFLNESQDRCVLFLGLEDPAQRAPIDEVGRATGLNVEPVVVGSLQLAEALDRFYPASAWEPGVGAAAPLIATDATPDEPAAVGTDAILEAEEPVLEAEMVPEEPASGTREPETPTRIILQALTKTLIAKGLIDSAELMAEVRRIQEKERG